MLLGCDYLDPIPKVGPVVALKLIREHKSLATLVHEMRDGALKGKFAIPDDYPHADARELFLHPDVLAASDSACDFKWEAPDVDGLLKFLVEEKGFSEDRVRSGAARLSKGLHTQQQSRLEGFFKPKEKSEEEKKALKRKNEEKATEKKKKAKVVAQEKKAAKAKPRGTA